MWTNNGYNIGINNYGRNLMVIASTSNGNSEVITSSVKCKSAVSAKRAVTKLMNTYGGEFTKVK
jgi:hypothetical protein